MQRLSLKDKIIFDHYFSRHPARLSMYSFASIFVWNKHFNIYWQILDNCLCIFFENELGCFMPLAPVGELLPGIVKGIFAFLEKRNNNGFASRIENIDAEDCKFYESLGLKLRPQDSEYLYRVRELINLSGNNFKSKRSSYNFFIKHYSYGFEKFDNSMAAACLGLYRNWAKQRSLKYEDKIYRSCLEDTFCAQEEAFKHFKNLGLSAWVVKVDGRIKGYSLGLKLNKNIYYIMFETADLDVKGLSQFLFKNFCQNLSDVEFVNAGCDCGFNNLSRVKQSYRPVQVLKSFIAERR